MLIQLMKCLLHSGTILWIQPFQDCIKLRKQLHIGIFNTIMHHLHKMAGAFFSDIGTAGCAVFIFGSDCSKDVRNFAIGPVFPGGHDAGTMQGSLFSTGNTASYQIKSILLHGLHSALCILIIGIPAVYQYIPFRKQWLQGCNDTVHHTSCRYH